LVVTGILFSDTADARRRSVSPPTQDEIKMMEEAMPTKPVVKPAKTRKVLVLSLCQGFKHGSIPFWDKALEIMGRKTGAFEVTVSYNLNDLSRQTLHQYDALCLNNTLA
jgi:hypothetical protein